MAVENTWLLRHGMVELRSISLVATPPTVSIESVSGVTSRSRSSDAAAESPESFPPCIDAPSATHSSGFIFLLGSRPVSMRTFSRTAGILVEPPTRRTLLSSLLLIPASESAVITGPAVRSTRSAVNSSNLALVTVISICFAPDLVVTINGRLTLVVAADESSFLAFSASSRTLCIAILSLLMSTPSVRLNSLTRYETSLSSKSSPPRWLSPEVARTSITLSPISITDTSNVPPPRSYTRIFWGSPLSSPYASAAAVGSLMIRSTLSPAILPASLVA